MQELQISLKLYKILERHSDHNSSVIGEVWDSEDFYQQVAEETNKNV